MALHAFQPLAHRRTLGRSQPRPSPGGFTIIELMLVLAAIGVLSALALPAYNGHRDRVRAADAMTDIRGLSVMAKSFYAEFGRYPARLSHAGSWPKGWRPRGSSAS